nr:hypothetical protein CJLB15_00057 [Campylobacter phage CJLB-15]
MVHKNDIITYNDLLNEVWNINHIYYIKRELV